MALPYSGSPSRSRSSSYGRFLWYELATTDVLSAEAFYSAVLGWGVQHVPGPDMDYTLLSAGGNAVAGLMQLPAQATEAGLRPSWLGYVGVDDVDVTAQRARAMGGAVHVAPKEIPYVSRFAVIQDQQGGAIGLFKWLTQSAPRSPDLNAAGHVGWHELLAADWERAWSFYADLFGWQQEDTDRGALGTYQLFSAAGETIGGMFNKPASVPLPLWIYYFNAGDIDAAMQRVKAASGEMLDAPVEVPGGRWILRCADPQGNVFALVGTRRHHGLGYFERVPRGGGGGVKRA